MWVNCELDQLTQRADVTSFLKIVILKLLGHVGRIHDKRISDWKPEGTRIRGRWPRKRRLDNLEKDLRIMRVGWTKLCSEKVD